MESDDALEDVPRRPGAPRVYEDHGSLRLEFRQAPLAALSGLALLGVPAAALGTPWLLYWLDLVEAGLAGGLRAVMLGASMAVGVAVAIRKIQLTLLVELNATEVRVLRGRRVVVRKPRAHTSVFLLQSTSWTHTLELDPGDQAPVAIGGLRVTPLEAEAVRAAVARHVEWCRSGVLGSPEAVPEALHQLASRSAARPDAR